LGFLSARVNKAQGPANTPRSLTQNPLELWGKPKKPGSNSADMGPPGPCGSVGSPPSSGPTHSSHGGALPHRTPSPNTSRAFSHTNCALPSRLSRPPRAPPPASRLCWKLPCLLRHLPAHLRPPPPPPSAPFPPCARPPLPHSCPPAPPLSPPLPLPPSAPPARPRLPSRACSRSALRSPLLILPHWLLAPSMVVVPYLPPASLSPCAVLLGGRYLCPLHPASALVFSRPLLLPRCPSLLPLRSLSPYPLW